ncbi:hypothetical protein [Streptomyces sp. NPDC046887]|uniref:hypothetical protein n=1 Tax=Streptomyces sp. NPDC046887 TaxID=3155472 RepID=UPI0033E4C31B
MTVPLPFPGQGDAALRWPTDLVVAELTRLIDATARDGLPAEALDLLAQEVTHFLGEAFADEGVLHEWKAALATAAWSDGTLPADAQTRWLTDLREAVTTAAPPRPAYWTRRGGDEARPLGLRETAAAVAGTVAELERAGYLAWAFGQNCVDRYLEGELGTDPGARMHEVLGRPGLWPIATRHPSYSVDDLADVIEFLADHVRRPTRSYRHDYADCGLHFSEFHAERGAQLYRARINAVLERSGLGLELAGNGRLRTVAPPGLGALVGASLTGPAVHAADEEELRHAVRRFQARGAGDLDRRHAVIALAGILERRRGLVSDHLLSKDAGSLFHIANSYGIRHQKADQRTEYDPGLYLEWVFYLFLSVIHLTDRIAAGQREGDPGAHPPDGAPS